MSPDIAGASQVTGGLRVAGEIKTPWVITHSLSQAIQHTPCEELRHVLVSNYESNDALEVPDGTLNDDDLSEPEAVAKAQDQELNKPQTMIADGNKEMARVKIERPLMTQPALETLINTLGNAPKMNVLGLPG
ncbi:hypothetical protein BDV30DRAFT_239166 [Aspergillus minisclerotigenes]|uniref:Uncharacterized protein n=1 Tax=Aspergillus minisclerotigenes TaxID=656917 RepID=A0A5N6J3L6_9EURO|nr:hypothetical protein BDV30DRAFT_239166 [Aspergillus minisclerotigenes]